jgi:hypothetical protein
MGRQQRPFRCKANSTDPARNIPPKTSIGKINNLMEISSTAVISPTENIPAFCGDTAAVREHIDENAL